MDERLTRWLLATILAVFLLLLSLPGARLGEAPALVERSVLWLASSVAGAVNSVADAIGDIGLALRTREQLERDNRRLNERVEQLERDNLRLSAAMGRLWVFESAQGFRRQSRFDLMTAEVVFRDDRSSTPGWIVRAPEGSWRAGQPVLGRDGVVGRVTVGSGRYVKVRPLTDYDHAMGAMIERSRRQGVVRGAGRSSLTLEYIPRGSDVRLGDRVVTSGTDGVFPRGLPVGEVVSVEESDDLLLRVGVRPAVDFATLEFVFLLSGERVSARSVVPEAGAGVGDAAEEGLAE